MKRNEKGRKEVVEKENCIRIKELGERRRGRGGRRGRRGKSQKGNTAENEPVNYREQTSREVLPCLPYGALPEGPVR